MYGDEDTTLVGGKGGQLVLFEVAWGPNTLPHHALYSKLRSSTPRGTGWSRLGVRVSMWSAAADWLVGPRVERLRVPGENHKRGSVGTFALYDPCSNGRSPHKVHQSLA